MTVHDAIIQFLHAHNVPFTMHDHVPATTVADAEAYLPFPPEQFLKTVVFRVKPDGWVLVALRGQDQVDYRKLAAALGVRRGDLDRPPAEDVEAALGFPVGGVAPIPLAAGTRVIVDSSAAGMGMGFCGAGRNDHTLEIALADLLRATGATVQPVAREAG